MIKRLYMAAAGGLEKVFGGGGILAYHGVGEDPILPELHVDPRELRAQIELLHAHYRVVPLTELLARKGAGRSISGCVAVTFDDAYVGVARAAELFAETATPVTVFVASAAATEGLPYWWDLIAAARAGSPADWAALLEAVGLAPTLDASEPGAYDAVHRRIQMELKGVPEAMVRRLGGILAATAWRSATFAEMDALARLDLVDFGVHTVRHPTLPLLSADEQLREIADCRRTLDERLPRVRPLIAYPYGFFDATTLRAAREAGMEWGVTTEARAPLGGDGALEIPRLCAAQTTDRATLTTRLGYPHAWGKRAMRRPTPWSTR